MLCLNQLKQLSIALLTYQDRHGSFPPAFVTDETGRPMHSWRVLILPYLDEQQLYEAYDFNEPWDGPNNSKLRDRMPTFYRCPIRMLESKAAYFKSHYMAVVDPRTAWPGAQPSEIDQFSDGIENTLLLLESTGAGVNWMEPQGISFDQAVASLVSLPEKGSFHGHLEHDFFYHDTFSIHGAFADGTARGFQLPVDEAIATALLTIQNGEPAPVIDSFNIGAPRRLNWVWIIVLALLVLISVFPACFVLRYVKE